MKLDSFPELAIEQLATYAMQDPTASIQLRLDALRKRLPEPHEHTPPSFELAFFSSPGRTELGGNHTDHNRGRVLAAAVDLDLCAVVRPRTDRVITLSSEGFPTVRVSLEELSPADKERGTPAALIRGMAAWLKRKGFVLPHGFDIAADSRVPPGSGLSSSAAFELLIAAILDNAGESHLSPIEWAHAGQYAENVFFGKPCGLMDQIACAAGGIVSIDFADIDEPAIHQIDYNFETAGITLCIVHTGSSHEDLTEEYASIPAEMRSVAHLLEHETLSKISKSDLLEHAVEIRNACGDRAFLRAWHFVHETERPPAMQSALEICDIDGYLRLVRESGLSSWQYLQNIHAGSPRQQSLAVALALTADFLGGAGACRVHGGGFAGTIQAYVPTEKFENYRMLMEGVFGPGCVQRLQLRAYGACRIIPEGGSAS